MTKQHIAIWLVNGSCKINPYLTGRKNPDWDSLTVQLLESGNILFLASVLSLPSVQVYTVSLYQNIIPCYPPSHALYNNYMLRPRDLSNLVPRMALCFNVTSEARVIFDGGVPSGARGLPRAWGPLNHFFSAVSALKLANQIPQKWKAMF